jgi:hypothetical protein
MNNAIAIVQESDGKVVTFVRPDQPAGWKPPEATRAVPSADLPPDWQMAEPQPQGEPITAEEHLKSVGLGGERQPTLLYLRQSLAAAGQQSPELDAIEQYLQQILAIFASDPSPRNDWPQPPVSFETAVQSAMSALNS